MNSARQSPEYLTVGRVVRPHGVRGAVLVESISELAAGLQSGVEIFLGSEARKAEVLRISKHQKRLILILKGLQTREQAEALRGQVVMLRVDQMQPLPEDSYFYWQILGMDVFDEDGKALGKIVEIIETGANDVYVVRAAEAKDLLLPAIAEVILSVDLEHSRMTVHLLPGLMP